MAWVNGAEDPVSGMAATLEEARALGELRKQGWSPKRTIIYCAWDGEEPALLGSTEWAEAHDAELQQHAVVYMNSDGNGRGFLQAEGSHMLEHFINDVARDIQDPETRLTVWKRKQAKAIDEAKPEDKEKVRSRAGLAHRRARIGLRLHAVSPAPRRADAEYRLRRRGRAAASITRFTTTSISTRISSTPTSPTAGRWRRPAARR